MSLQGEYHLVCILPDFLVKVRHWRLQGGWKRFRTLLSSCRIAQQAQQADSGAPDAAGVEAPAADAQAADGQAPGQDGTTDAQASEWSATPLKKFEVLYTQERSEKDKEVSQLLLLSYVAGLICMGICHILS